MSDVTEGKVFAFSVKFVNGATPPRILDLPLPSNAVATIDRADAGVVVVNADGTGGAFTAGTVDGPVNLGATAGGFTAAPVALNVVADTVPAGAVIVPAAAPDAPAGATIVPA